MKNPVGAFAGRSWSVPSVGRSPPILLSTVSCPYPPTTPSSPQPTPLHPSRHRLTVSLVGRREGTGLLTSLPSLCFGPSVHASGRQGQGPARFLVPLVNRGPVARRASSVGTAHSVHSPAPGGGRNERSEERAVILPSHHGPSPSLPAEPGQGSDRLSLISSVPSLRRVTSFPVTSVRYALRSLRSLSFFACHVIPALRPRGRNRDGTARSLTSPPSLPRPVPFVPHGPSGGYGRD